MNHAVAGSAELLDLLTALNI